MTTLEVTVADGRVESAGNGVITGWAWSPAEPEVRVRVNVWVDGRIVASGPADRQAPGLKKVGIGDGRHAFAIELPEELAHEDGELAVAVRVAGVAERLTMLSGWNDLGDGAWSGVRMAPDNNPPPAPPIADDGPPPAAEPAAAALVGLGGWLFAYPDGGADPAAVEDAVAALQRSGEELAALGIRYVVAVAPPKVTVYRDRLLHPGVPQVAAARSLERLTRHSDVLEILDLSLALSDARGHGDLFLPRDEGWSALGALHVQRALIKRAGLARLRPTPLAEARFTRGLEPPPEGLVGLPVVGPEGDGSEPPVPDAADAHALRAQRVPAAEHLDVEGGPAARVYERADAVDLPRVVLVGDPCIHAVVPWLAEACSRLIVFGTPTPPMVPIELEFPDVVFHVLEERRLGGA